MASESDRCVECLVKKTAHCMGDNRMMQPKSGVIGSTPGVSQNLELATRPLQLLSTLVQARVLLQCSFKDGADESNRVVASAVGVASSLR